MTHPPIYFGAATTSKSLTTSRRGIGAKNSSVKIVLLICDTFVCIRDLLMVNDRIHLLVA